MDVGAHFGMCLLVPFLPSCLLKIYLELKQATHGGRSLFTQDLVTGPRTAPFTTSNLHLKHQQPTKSAQISTFCWATGGVVWDHVISNSGLNPRPENELQLQQEKSNYMRPIPAEELPAAPLPRGLTCSLLELLPTCCSNFSHLRGELREPGAATGNQRPQAGRHL